MRRRFDIFEIIRYQPDINSSILDIVTPGRCTIDICFIKLIIIEVESRWYERLDRHSRTAN